MDPGVADGLLGLAGIVAMVAVPLGALLYRREIWRRVRRLFPEEAPPAPAPHAIAGLAADLRRLDAEHRHPPVGRPVVVRRGVEKALDDALAEACVALDVPDTVTGAPDRARDEERERVIDRLEGAGLAVRARA